MTTPALPQTCPVFPLSGAILLPGGALPLNIFEPRYLAMVGDAMAGDRMIGMVQPRNDDDPPALHAVGGLGRITEFAETPDGRYLIVLTGVSRFRIVEELAVPTPYRQCRIDFGGFEADLADPRPLAEGMRPELEQALRLYLDGQDLSADWDAVAQADDDALVRTLSAVCPFPPIEKQALLEAADLPARARLLVALMRFAPSAESPSTTLQ
ncbi:MAG: LON peptidase substrate-binding domain-containing protein [Sphingomonadaceae bacterium]